MSIYNTTYAPQAVDLTDRSVDFAPIDYDLDCMYVQPRYTEDRTQVLVENSMDILAEILVSFS